MKQKPLIFLKPFTIKNPTLDEQNEFIMRENVTEIEYSNLGIIFGNDDYYGQDIATFIANKVKALHPEWIVAEGQCATAVLAIRNQKKVLLNPKVSFEHLNNISDFDIENTYGFFDDRHEKDYERFQSVYPHAAWSPQDDNLNLLTIKDVIEEIING